MMYAIVIFVCVIVDAIARQLWCIGHRLWRWQTIKRQEATLSTDCA